MPVGWLFFLYTILFGVNTVSSLSDPAPVVGSDWCRLCQLGVFSFVTRGTIASARSNHARLPALILICPRFCGTFFESLVADLQGAAGVLCRNARSWRIAFEPTFKASARTKVAVAARKSWPSFR